MRQRKAQEEWSRHRRQLLWGIAVPILAMVLAVGSPCSAQEAAEQNLIQNPGFENQALWEIVLRGDAQGSAERDRATVRNGAHSMKLTKGNPVGFVILRHTSPIPVKANQVYTFRGWYHTQGTEIPTVLLFRVGPKDGNLSYDSVDKSQGWPSQSLLVNSPKGKWEKRVVTHKPSEDGEVYLHVVLYGNPATVWLDDLEFTPGTRSTTASSTEFETPFTAEQVAVALAGRENATAKVGEEYGHRVLTVNGEKVPAVLYKGEPYKTEGDYSRFGKAGVNLATVSVRLGSIKNEPGTWLGAGKFDFASADEAILKALRRNPEAHLIVDVGIYPYREWGEENPQDCWADGTGQRAYGWWGNVEGFATELSGLTPADRHYWWYPSYNSAKWRADASEALAALVRHLRTTEAWKAVVGFYITGGHDGQFQVFNRLDHSEATRQAFARWCEKRYGTVEKLSAAWGRQVGAFGEVTVPADREGVETYGVYLPGGHEVDYRRFAHESAWELRDAFAGAVKSQAEKDVITIAYGNPPDYDFHGFLSTSNLDASASMSNYAYRRPGYAAGYIPFDSFDLHGKLFFQELDLRSWTGAGHSELYDSWVSAAPDAATWEAIHKKLVGVSLAKGCGFWYYDMNHYFDAPEMMAGIAQAHEQAAQLLTRRDTFRPEVVVIRGGGANHYLTDYFSSVKAAEIYQLMELETSGVPFDLHCLDDVLSRPELQEYKVFVFMNVRTITSEQRLAIKEKLKTDGKTLVWLHDSGYLSETGASVEAMSALTDVQTVTQEGQARQTMLVPTLVHPLTENVPTFASLTELFMGIMTLDGASSFSGRGQAFWPRDPNSRPVAMFAEDGSPAGVVKRIALDERNSYTTVYIAAPNALAGAMLNNIAQEAKAFTSGLAGPAVHMSGNFISVHALKTGRYFLRVPPDARRVVDLATGKMLGQNITQVNLTLDAQQTYWLGVQ